MKTKISASPEFADSGFPSATGHEDNTPLVLVSLGWTSSPDGRDELRVECNTLIDYVTMPKKLFFGPLTLVKAEWDKGKKAALYRRDEAAHLAGKTNSEQHQFPNLQTL